VGLRGERDFAATGFIVVDLSQYLPILIFIFIALGLSVAFVLLPMGVSRLTGAHNADFLRLMTRAASLTFAFISSQSASSSSIWKRPSCSHGR
jgi:Na+/H+-dicarboxylate symporter